ncbi:hypothetical protein ILUMI_14790 [Ignelater luminosus]|uniref:Uncharacterized protein n=1 Tax=Ignelater luminosus TaxID=2038154 RepID=A0A8K0CPT6_IGNLU|nr:hypothetical protein ILUMI_14790 [Ignelater luminosus]
MENVTFCYYLGYRYPYFHPQKYEQTREFLLQLSLKFIVVFIFEHLMAIMAGLIAASIPSLPYSVKTQLNIQQQKMKESRIEILNETFTNKVGKLSTAKNKKLILPFPTKILSSLSNLSYTSKKT